MGQPTTVLFEEEKKIADSVKVMEKWWCGLNKKVVLEAMGPYVNENSIMKACKVVLDDGCFMWLKKCLRLKKPQGIKVGSKNY
jgi:hypothetical protein